MEPVLDGTSTPVPRRMRQVFTAAAPHGDEAIAWSLLTLCGPGGADGARTLLEQSLKEEEAMAHWVDQNVAEVTLAYVNKQQRAAA